MTDHEHFQHMLLPLIAAAFWTACVSAELKDAVRPLYLLIHWLAVTVEASPILALLCWNLFYVCIGISSPLYFCFFSL